MSEIIYDGTPHDPQPEHLLPARADVFADVGQQLGTSETTIDLRAAQEAWLERRHIEPVRLQMSKPAWDVFRNAPQEYVGYVKQCYGISETDQENTQFALIDLVPDDPSLPHDSKLVDVTEEDFGTAIDATEIAKDFQTPGSDPNDPMSPEGALHVINIGEDIDRSQDRLQSFSRKLMSGKTDDPFNALSGDIAVRAGELRPGQEDAYVWRAGANPFAESVALTVAFPHQYRSVCVVSGEMRDAPNGKPRMAQMVNPKEVLRIEGDNLKQLQDIYRKLYEQPNFALTERQRAERDELFNDRLTNMISESARKNKAYEDTAHQDVPQQMAREIPRY